MRLACMLSSLAIALSLCTAAEAQIVGQRDYGSVGISNPFLPDSQLPAPPVGAEVRQIRDRIDRLRDNGLLSRREARRLDREARRIGHAAYRYARDGLSASERSELRSRAAVLREEVNRPRG